MIKCAVSAASFAPIDLTAAAFYAATHSPNNSSSIVTVLFDDLLEVPPDPLRRRFVSYYSVPLDRLVVDQLGGIRQIQCGAGCRRDLLTGLSKATSSIAARLKLRNEDEEAKEVLARGNALMECVSKASETSMLADAFGACIAEMYRRLVGIDVRCLSYRTILESSDGQNLVKSALHRIANAIVAEKRTGVVRFARGGAVEVRWQGKIFVLDAARVYDDAIILYSEKEPEGHFHIRI